MFPGKPCLQEISLTRPRTMCDLACEHHCRLVLTPLQLRNAVLTDKMIDNRMHVPITHEERLLHRPLGRCTE